MGYPTIQYNSSTGSDTSPTGNDGSGTNGDMSSGGFTLTLNETVDFTGVADDGTDYVWFDGAAGDRHLFAVSSFNPSVAACTTITMIQTASATRTGSNWAVNGVRQTLENDTSQPDTHDHCGGWDIDLVGTFTLSVQAEPAADINPTGPAGPVRYFTSGARPEIIMNHVSAGGILIDIIKAVTFEGIKFSVGASGTSNSYIFLKSSCEARFFDCVFDGSDTASWGIRTDSACRLTVIGCYFSGHLTVGIECGNSDTGTSGFILGNTFDGGGTRYSTAAINVMDGATGWTIADNLIQDCTGRGIYYDVESGVTVNIIGNTIVHNDSDGIFFDVHSDTGVTGCFFNNIIAFNGAYGVEAGSAATFNWDRRLLKGNNAFYNNTSGARLNVTAGVDDIALSADPFVDYTDYELNDTVGGGAECKDSRFPTSLPSGS